jgi:hypothetical protein
MAFIRHYSHEALRYVPICMPVEVRPEFCVTTPIIKDVDCVDCLDIIRN